MISGYDVHPVASLFPMANDTDLSCIADSIARHGLQEPIEMLDGKVLDGRNRLVACGKVHVEPEFIDVDLNGMSPVDYVMVRNRDRRQLSTAQRSFVAANLREYLLKEDPDEAFDSTQKAADIMNVSRRSVASAINIVKDGSVGLKDGVRTGAVTIRQGEALSKLPKMDQQLAMASGKTSIRELLNSAKAPHAGKPLASAEDRRVEWDSSVEIIVTHIRKLVKQLPTGPWRDKTADELIEGALTTLCQTIQGIKGHKICPLCNGSGCQGCLDTGFMNRITYENNRPR